MQGYNLVRYAYDPCFTACGHPGQIQRPHMAAYDVIDPAAGMKIQSCVSACPVRVGESVQRMSSVIIAVPVIQKEIMQHRSLQQDFRIGMQMEKAVDPAAERYDIFAVIIGGYAAVLEIILHLLYPPMGADAGKDLFFVLFSLHLHSSRMTQKQDRNDPAALFSWWSLGDSNSRPPDCEPGALPAELKPRVEQ